MNLPGGPVVKFRALNAGGPGSIPGGPVVKFRTLNAGGPGSIPGRGTRSHMHATTKKSACHN